MSNQHAPLVERLLGKFTFVRPCYGGVQAAPQSLRMCARCTVLLSLIFFARQQGQHHLGYQISASTVASATPFPDTAIRKARLARDWAHNCCSHSNSVGLRGRSIIVRPLARSAGCWCATGSKIGGFDREQTGEKMAGGRAGGPANEWFNPVIKFGPVNGSKGDDAPLMLYVPGIEGSGLTPTCQFPELASAFDVQCLAFEAKDRSTFSEIKANVKARVREAKEKGREVYLVGESFGGILALSLGIDDSEPAEMPDRIELVNVATSFERTLIGRLSPTLLALPEPFFTMSILPVVFLLFDKDMFGNLAKLASNTEWSQSEDRREFLKKVIPKLGEAMLRLRGGDLKFRVKNWVLTGCTEENSRLKDVKVPVLAVAGTADLLLPSQEEALKLKEEIPDCNVRFVEGAGHTGTLDARADLLKLIRSWERTSELATVA